MQTDINFLCLKCGECCRQPGYVRLSESEVTAIADYLGMQVQDFTENFTRLTRERDCLSLVEKQDQSCVFLQYDSNCAIQMVKPRQCRDFPLLWKFSESKTICPVLGKYLKKKKS